MSEQLKDKKSNYAVMLECLIMNQRFRGCFVNDDSDITLCAAWLNDGRFSFDDFARHFHMEVPDFINELLTVMTLSFEYGFKTKRIQTVVDFQSGMHLMLAVQNKKLSFLVSYAEGKNTFLFSNIPGLGNVFGDTDGIRLDYIKAENGQFGFQGSLHIGGTDLDLTFPKDERAGPDEPQTQISSLSQENKPAPEQTAAQRTESAPPQTEPETPSLQGEKWFDINKSFSILRINRIGFAFKDNKVCICLDAGFTFSIFSVEFYALSVCLPLGGGSFDYGLKGLLISYHKPPLKIVGGLYLDNVDGIPVYNGILQFQFSQLAFSLLGSYTEILVEEKKSPSFFAFLMIEFPLGGPPFFFVTGLAFGIGINREIILPEISQVDKFPFVQMAMGNSSVEPTDAPGVALNKISDWIKPKENSYFISAGVKFTSFSLVTSFALLNIEFGAKVRISMLGKSVMTMPPNLSLKERPIMYAELLLKAVIDLESGVIEVIAALSANSYVLDKSCKIAGGFAFCVWTKGERGGDFMISLGGCHHPLFKNKDMYPKVSKLGINWQISNNLSLKGESYFAVTPSCAMAGFDASIDYRAGELHAWLRASASFYIKWKPLFFDINISISIGVSYSIFRLEVGAGLHMWGPEVSGALTVKLFICSFTISFGSGRVSPPPLSWNEFKETFLQIDHQEIPCGLEQIPSGNETDAEINSAKVSGSIIREDKEKDQLIVRPYGLGLTTHSLMPCTKFVFNGSQLTFAANQRPGIAPMNISQYEGEHNVSLYKDSDGAQTVVNAANFKVSVIQENLGAAIWGNGAADINADLMRGQGTGLEIALKFPKINNLLPEKADPDNPATWYSLSVLEDLHVLEYCWNKVTIHHSPAEKFTKFAADKRIPFKQLSAIFKTRTTSVRKDIYMNPDNYYLSDFYLCRTGNYLEKEEGISWISE